MEYEFRRNSLEGTVQATFEMGHEVLGRWVSDELGNDKKLVSGLLSTIKLLSQGELNQYRLVGSDFTLEMNTEQAWVYANVLAYEEEQELEDGMAIYDSESNSYCGLEDFEYVLLSWQSFLNEK